MPAPPPFYATGPQQTIKMRDSGDWRRNEALAQLLQQDAQRAQVQSPWEGALRLGQVALSGLHQKRAEEGRQGELDALQKVLMESGYALPEGIDLGMLPPEVTNAMLANALSPKERETIVVNGRLVYADTGELIEDYSTPDLKEIDDAGYVWNSETRTWDLVAGTPGGVAATRGGPPKDTKLPSASDWVAIEGYYNAWQKGMPLDQIPADVQQYFGVLKANGGKAPASGGDDGSFSGSVDAQAMNILLYGDPASQEYLAAWNHLSAPKLTTNPTTGETTYQYPDMSAYKRPTFKGGAAEGGAAVEGQSAYGDPSRVETTDTTASTKNKEAMTAVQRTFDAVVDYEATLDKADPGAWETLGAAAGMPNENMALMQQKYNYMLMQMKGLLELGVLAGEDMTVMTKIMIDPTDLGSAAISNKTFKAQIREMKNILRRTKQNLAGSTAGLEDLPAEEGGIGGVTIGPSEPDPPLGAKIVQ